MMNYSPQHTLLDARITFSSKIARNTRRETRSHCKRWIDILQAELKEKCYFMYKIKRIKHVCKDQVRWVSSFWDDLPPHSPLVGLERCCPITAPSLGSGILWDYAICQANKEAMAIRGSGCCTSVILLLVMCCQQRNCLCDIRIDAPVQIMRTFMSLCCAGHCPMLSAHGPL